MIANFTKIRLRRFSSLAFKNFHNYNNNYHENHNDYDDYNNDNFHDYDDYNNKDLFIEKVNYNNVKKYFTITKEPYYLDEDYIKKYNFEKFKKIDIICENVGSKCFNCNGSGYILNEIMKYDKCTICNGTGLN